MANGLKILLVDDNMMVIKALGWALEAWGHQVRLATDGVTALAIAKEFKPDAAVLDLTLPGMNGLEIAQNIRADEHLKNCLLIAQTGWTQPEHKHRSLEAGFNHHLVKPVDAALIQNLLLDLHKSAVA